MHKKILSDSSGQARVGDGRNLKRQRSECSRMSVLVDIYRYEIVRCLNNRKIGQSIFRCFGNSVFVLVNVGFGVTVTVLEIPCKREGARVRAYRAPD